MVMINPEHKEHDNLLEEAIDFIEQACNILITIDSPHGKALMVAANGLLMLARLMFVNKKQFMGNYIYPVWRSSKPLREHLSLDMNIISRQFMSDDTLGQAA